VLRRFAFFRRFTGFAAFLTGIRLLLYFNDFTRLPRLAWQARIDRNTDRKRRRLERFRRREFLGLFEAIQGFLCSLGWHRSAPLRQGLNHRIRAMKSRQTLKPGFHETGLAGLRLVQAERQSFHSDSCGAM
jgi:hypothetical protein